MINEGILTTELAELAERFGAETIGRRSYGGRRVVSPAERPASGIGRGAQEAKHNGTRIVLCLLRPAPDAARASRGTTAAVGATTRISLLTLLTLW